MSYLEGVLLTLILFCSTVTAEKVEPGEEDLLVNEGEDITLTCQAIISEEHGLRWNKGFRTIYQTSPPDWSKHRKYDRSKYLPKQISGKNYSLTIFNVNRNDSDTFSCELVDLKKTTRHVYRLYIFDSKKMYLPVNLEEGITYSGTCEVGYYHPHGPPGTFEIEVKMEGKLLTMGNQKKPVCSKTKRHCSISEAFKISADRKYHNKKLECVVKSSSNLNIAYSLDVRIIYPPQRFDIDPAKKSFHIGETINCYAQANPEASLMWKSSSGVEFSGNVLFILRNMSGNQRWTCSSSNWPDVQNTEVEFVIEDEASLNNCIYTGLLLLSALLLVNWVLLYRSERLLPWRRQVSLKTMYICLTSSGLVITLLSAVFMYIDEFAGVVVLYIGLLVIVGGTIISILRRVRSGSPRSKDSGTSEEEDRLLAVHQPDTCLEIHHLQIMKEPQKLIQTDRDGTLVVVEEVLDQLKSLKGHVVVVAIAGMLRTGKSYLLNRLAGKSEGFALGSTIEPKTKGMWIWVRPHPKRDGTNLVLLDTEGLGDPKKAKVSSENWLFTLAMLFSSTVIHNVLGGITGDMFNRLSFISDLSKQLKISSKDNTGRDDDFDMHFPQFVVTVRDFSLVLRADGHDISADDYLERSLQIKEGNYNPTRMTVRKYYKKRKCFVFDTPATREILDLLGTVSEDKISPDFLEDVKRFCDFVHDECEPLELPDGQLMDGAALASLIKFYTDAVGKKEELCVQSAVEKVREEQEKEALQGGIEKYREFMDRELELPTLDEEMFEECHQKARNAAIQYFVKKMPISGSHHEKQLSDEILEVRREYEVKNQEASKTRCKRELKAHREKILNGLINPGYGEAELKNDLQSAEHGLKRSGIMAQEEFNIFKQEMEELLDRFDKASLKPAMKGISPTGSRSKGQGNAEIEMEKQKIIRLTSEKMTIKEKENEDRRAKKFREMQEYRLREESRLREEGLINQADELHKIIEDSDKDFDKQFGHIKKEN